MKSEGQRKEGVDRKEGIGGEQQGSTGEHRGTAGKHRGAQGSTGERGTNESR